MFTVAAPDQTYQLNVTVQCPQPEGSFAEADYTAEVVLLSYSKITEIQNAAVEANENPDIPIIRQALRGWRDIHDADGTVMAFNPTNLALVCNLPYFSKATVTAYLKWAAGAPEKN